MNPVLLGTANLIIYFVIAVCLVFPARALITIPDELFRKILHLVLLGSFLVLIVAYPTWLMSACAAIIFEIVVYPILVMFEHTKKYSEFTTERKTGELKKSLMLVYTMFAVVVSICWGGFGDKFLALASLYAWGIGDGAAALVGKKYGKHKIHAPGLDGKKSYEGTVAMFLVSCISTFTILMYRGGLGTFPCALIAIVVGAVSAIVELYSKNGNDTVFCPISAMIVLLPLVYLFGGM